MATRKFGTTTAPTAASAQLTRRAREAFGDPAIADKWLNARSDRLNSRTPLQAAVTPEGLQAALDVLLQIEHGIFP